MVPRTNLFLKASHKLATTEDMPEEKAGEHGNWSVSMEMVWLSFPAGREGNVHWRHRFHTPLPLTKYVVSRVGYSFSSCAPPPQSEPGTRHAAPKHILHC